MIHRVRCGRCQTRGAILTAPVQGKRREVRCPVCLGLGEYEYSDRYKKPEHFTPETEGFVVAHSNVPVADLIELLPEGKPDE